MSRTSSAKLLTIFTLLVLSFSGCAKIKTTVTGWIDKFKNEKSATVTQVVQTLQIKTENGTLNLKVEVADTLEKRTQGYMFREKVGDDEGMLFTFDDEAVHKFWMRNTKVPLDMIFVNKNMEIRAIAQNVQPCTKDPCEIFSSPDTNAYVLEVAGGFSAKNGVKVGDTILRP